MPTPVAGDVLRFIRRYSDRPAPDPEFTALALRVFRFQFDNNAFYRRFCGTAGRTPRDLRTWKDIPAMPAAAFKDLVLTSFPMRRKKRIFRTSGTTASARGAHFFETLDLYDASLAPSFKEYVLGSGKYLFFFLMPKASEVPDSSLSYMMESVNKRFARGKGKFYVRAGKPLYEALAEDLSHQKKRTLLLSTAFALKGFLEYLEERNEVLRLPVGSRLMETGGFKGRAKEVSKTELYRLCRKWLGLSLKECVSEYGMTELSSQYYSRSGGPFAAPAWMRTMVMDPLTGTEVKKGRPGLLKHVDLANIGSVMAVQTEDLGRAKGNGFEFLGRAQGSEARGCSLSYERFLRSSR